VLMEGLGLALALRVDLVQPDLGRDRRWHVIRASALISLCRPPRHEVRTWTDLVIPRSDGEDGRVRAELDAGNRVGRRLDELGVGRLGVAERHGGLRGCVRRRTSCGWRATGRAPS